MEAVTDGWIPESIQLLAAFLIGLVIIAGSIIKYVRDWSKPEDEQPAFDVKVLGAAFGEAQALREIADAQAETAVALDKMHDLLDRSVERDLVRHEKHVEYLHRIAEALEAGVKAIERLSACLELGQAMRSRTRSPRAPPGRPPGSTSTPEGRR